MPLSYDALRVRSNPRWRQARGSRISTHDDRVYDSYNCVASVLAKTELEDIAAGSDSEQCILIIMRRRV